MIYIYRLIFTNPFQCLLFTTNYNLKDNIETYLSKYIFIYLYIFISLQDDSISLQSKGLLDLLSFIYNIGGPHEVNRDTPFWKVTNDKITVIDPMKNYNVQFIYNCKLVSSIYDTLSNYDLATGFIMYLHQDSISIDDLCYILQSLFTSTSSSPIVLPNAYNVSVIELECVLFLIFIV